MIKAESNIFLRALSPSVALALNDPSKNAVHIAFHATNNNRACVTVNGREYPAILLQLPTLVELHRGGDGGGGLYHKAGNVGRILLVCDGQEQCDALARTTVHCDGITAITKNIHKRRFCKNKTLAPDIVERHEQILTAIKDDDKITETYEVCEMEVEVEVEVEHQNDDDDEEHDGSVDDDEDEEHADTSDSDSDDDDDDDKDKDNHNANELNMTVHKEPDPIMDLPLTPQQQPPLPSIPPQQPPIESIFVPEPEPVPAPVLVVQIDAREQEEMRLRKAVDTSLNLILKRRAQKRLDDFLATSTIVCSVK